jgi:hypothetical protein
MSNNILFAKNFVPQTLRYFSLFQIACDCFFVLSQPLAIILISRRHAVFFKTFHLIPHVLLNQNEPPPTTTFHKCICFAKDQMRFLCCINLMQAQ